ncbi:MAG: UDP-glucose 4-epimerase GalE [Methylophilaceae bacterium]
MNNILITGGTGYIGSHVALELLLSQFNVFVVDNLSNSNTESIRAIKSLTNKEIYFYEGDICDQTFLDKFFKKNDIDCVVHCAGLKAVAESISKPFEYYQNNLIGTLNLISCMNKYSVKKIIFSSSAVVYDKNQVMPINETSKVGHGQNPYARTKIIIENFLQDLFYSDPKWSVTLLRYFNPVGNDPSCLMGEDPVGIPNNLMPLINEAAFNLRQLIVFGSNYETHDGTAVRDYIHVSDIAKGHVLSVRQTLDFDHKLKIYNLGLGKGVSVLEIINTYEKVNNVKLNYKFGDRREGDLPICFADNTNARKELSWDPKFSIEDMCKHSYQWYQQKISRVKS